MTDHMQDVLKDVAQMKLQVNLAVATADAAKVKAQELEIKVKQLTEQKFTMADVEQKIEEAIMKIKIEIENRPRMKSSNVSGASRSNHGEIDEAKAARTMVIGGFMPDSEKGEVMAMIEKHVIAENDKTVEEIYAYSFGSIGFVRFVSADNMREFLKSFGSKPRPKVDDKNIWATASKSPGERRKAKHLGKHKRVLIEVGLAGADEIKIDYRRGILMVKRNRVAEWQGDGIDGHVELHEDNLKKVGIDVGATVLKNAVEELLSQ